MAACFSELARDGRAFRGTHTAFDVAHRTAAAEDHWRERFGWDKMPLKDAWRIHKSTLVNDQARRHLEWQRPSADKGEPKYVAQTRRTRASWDFLKSRSHTVNADLTSSAVICT